VIKKMASFDERIRESLETFIEEEIFSGKEIN